MAQPLTVTTLAGRFQNSNFQNGVGTNALILGSPERLTTDLSGNIYVLDGQSVRKIGPDSTVSTFVGKPYTGGSADGTGASALFDFLDYNVTPGNDVAADAAGNLFIADTGNMLVRKVTPEGVVTTLAGSGSPGHQDGPAAQAQFYNPQAITVDGSGNVFVVDNDMYPKGPTIRKITPGGVVSTLAGGLYGNADGQGASAQFSVANGVTVDSSGTLYVADGWGIRKVSPAGNVTTWAGNPNVTKEVDGPLASAGFGVSAFKIALDGTGGAYVTDGDTVRYISSAGAVATVAGAAGQSATVSNDGVGNTALFGNALGLSVDAHRNVIISDAGNDTILKGVPPSLPGIGSFSESPGGTPARTSNPWQFSAAYSTVASDLRLRVQSTTDTNNEAAWTDLPGNHFMANVDGNWTLNSTEVPVGMRYFRVVASAPGYFDSVSTAVGPESVTQGFDPWGYFSYATTVPYSTATPWSFAIGQTAKIPGMSLRMQASATPGQSGNWTDLPGGQMSAYSNGKDWVLYTTNLPAGNITFRVVASATNFVDSISAPLGPFQIGVPLPVATTNVSRGGTYTLQDFNLFGAVMNVIHAVGVYVHLIPADPTTTTPAAITLSADKGSSVDLKVSKGQVLTTSGVNVGAKATVVLSGTVNGNVNVGVVSNDGGSIVSHDGGSVISNDGGSVVSNDGGSFAQDDVTVQVADAVLSDPKLIGQDGLGLIGEDGSSLIGQDGLGLIGEDGSSLIAQDGSNLTGKTSGTTAGGSTLKALAALRQSKVATTSSTGPVQPAFIGQMTVNGDYNQSGGTFLVVGIAGTNTLASGAQQFDQLVVSGRASVFHGSILFMLMNPNDQTNRAGVFQPSEGDTFDVVVASNIVANGVHLVGPVWGDGLFFSGSVVARPDGLQAVRLTAMRSAPHLFVVGAPPSATLVYGTNYAGYTVQSATSLAPANWAPYAGGTNVIPLVATNASRFFRLTHP